MSDKPIYRRLDCYYMCIMNVDGRLMMSDIPQDDRFVICLRNSGELFWMARPVAKN